MKIVPAIHQARERYVAFLRECLDRARADHGEVTAEGVIRLSGPPDWSELQRTLRIDLLWKDGNEPHAAKVETEALMPGPPVAAMQVEGMEVLIHPVAWHMCPVRFVHENPDFSPVNEWFRKWLGESSPRNADADSADGLGGVVHSLSPPMREGETWILLVDFGSAPVAAVGELLQALQAMNASDVKLGSVPTWELKRATLQSLAGDLDIATFADTVAAIFRSELDAAVEVVSPMELKIQGPNSASVRANLENLYRVMLKLDVAGRANEIGRWLESHREQFAKLSGEVPPPSLDALRPMVKDQQFIDAVRQKVGAHAPKIWRRLAGDLWIVYVWDLPNGMQFLTNDDPAKHGLSTDALHSRAVQNFLKARPRVEVEPQGGVFMARTHDNYDASLLLDDAFWRQVASKIRGDLLACVPTRDVVLISGTGEDGGLARLRQTAKKLMEGGDHLVSATVLRRAHHKWEVFAGHAGTPDPAPEKKKRPWWKFW